MDWILDTPTGPDDGLERADVRTRDTPGSDLIVPQEDRENSRIISEVYAPRFVAPAILKRKQSRLLV